MFGNGEDDFFQRQVKVFGSRFDDAQIGLMRDEEVDVFRLHLLLFEQFGDKTRKGAYRDFEHFSPFHVNERQAVAHGVRSGTTPARHQQQLFVTTIAM